MIDSVKIGIAIVAFWFFLFAMFVTESWTRVFCLVAMAGSIKYGLYIHETRGWRELDNA
jgi:hypothetical protein